MELQVALGDGQRGIAGLPFAVPLSVTVLRRRGEPQPRVALFSVDPGAPADFLGGAELLVPIGRSGSSAEARLHGKANHAGPVDVTVTLPEVPGVSARLRVDVVTGVITHKLSGADEPLRYGVPYDLLLGLQDRPLSGDPFDEPVVMPRLDAQRHAITLAVQATNAWISRPDPIINFSQKLVIVPSVVRGDVTLEVSFPGDPAAAPATITFSVDGIAADPVYERLVAHRWHPDGVIEQTEPVLVHLRPLGLDALPPATPGEQYPVPFQVQLRDERGNVYDQELDPLWGEPWDELDPRIPDACPAPPPHVRPLHVRWSPGTSDITSHPPDERGSADLPVSEAITVRPFPVALVGWYDHFVIAVSSGVAYDHQAHEFDEGPMPMPPFDHLRYCYREHWFRNFNPGVPTLSIPVPTRHPGFVGVEWLVTSACAVVPPGTPQAHATGSPPLDTFELTFQARLVDERGAAKVGWTVEAEVLPPSDPGPAATTQLMALATDADGAATGSGITRDVGPDGVHGRVRVKAAHGARPATLRLRFRAGEVVNALSTARAPDDPAIVVTVPAWDPFVLRTSPTATAADTSHLIVLDPRMQLPRGYVEVRVEIDQDLLRWGGKLIVAAVGFVSRVVLTSHGVLVTGEQADALALGALLGAGAGIAKAADEAVQGLADLVNVPSAVMAWLQAHGGTALKVIGQVVRHGVVGTLIIYALDPETQRLIERLADELWTKLQMFSQLWEAIKKDPVAMIATVVQGIVGDTSEVSQTAIDFGFARRSEAHDLVLTSYSVSTLSFYVAGTIATEMFVDWASGGILALLGWAARAYRASGRAADTLTHLVRTAAEAARAGRTPAGDLGARALWGQARFFDHAALAGGLERRLVTAIPDADRGRAAAMFSNLASLARDSRAPDVPFDVLARALAEDLPGMPDVTHEGRERAFRMLIDMLTSTEHDGVPLSAVVPDLDELARTIAGTRRCLTGC